MRAVAPSAHFADTSSKYFSFGEKVGDRIWRMKGAGYEFFLLQSRIHTRPLVHWCKPLMCYLWYPKS